MDASAIDLLHFNGRVLTVDQVDDVQGLVVTGCEQFALTRRNLQLKLILDVVLLVEFDQMFVHVVCDVKFL